MPIRHQIAVVVNEADLVVVPFEVFVSLLLVEKKLEPGGSPILFAEMAFHRRHDVHEFLLITWLTPPEIGSGPFRVYWKVDEGNRPWTSMGVFECRSVEERTIVAVETIPACDSLVCSGALKLWREFWTHLSCVSVTELMERAPMLIEDAVIGVDQAEQRVFI